MTILQATWECVLLSNWSGLFNGGTAGLIWTTIVVWLFMLALIASIAEMASMAPNRYTVLFHSYQKITCTDNQLVAVNTVRTGPFCMNKTTYAITDNVTQTGSLSLPLPLCRNHSHTQPAGLRPSVGSLVFHHVPHNWPASSNSSLPLRTRTPPSPPNGRSLYSCSHSPS